MEKIETDRDKLKRLQQQKQNAAKTSTVFLLAAMAIMALWGWTPLKQTIDALPVLIIFLGTLAISLYQAALTTVKRSQAQSLKNFLADQGTEKEDEE